MRSEKFSDAWKYTREFGDSDEILGGAVLLEDSQKPLSFHYSVEEDIRMALYLTGFRFD